MSNDNESNPQNAFNIGTVLNPNYSILQMEKIMYLERRNLDSTPIRNPLLNDEQIEILTDAIDNKINVSLFCSSLILPEKMKEKINKSLIKENNKEDDTLQNYIDKYKEELSTMQQAKNENYIDRN